MSNPLSVPARTTPVTIEAAAPILRGCMRRFVIDKNLAALREFHDLGIPLDFALDYAVQTGSMPMIDEMLNNFGVAPSDETLLRAMRRGVTIRNMFLNQVAPTGRHMIAAVLAEHYDTANYLLGRGIPPTLETISAIKGTAKQTEERREFIDRLIAGMSNELINNPITPKKMIYWTSVAQFERALDRIEFIPLHRLNDWLSESLYCAAPGHARVLINRGAQFEPKYLDIVGHGAFLKTDHNPTSDFAPVVRAVIETAIDQNCFYTTVEEADWLARQVVNKFAFQDRAQFKSLVELLSRGCVEEIRPKVCKQLVTYASQKQRRTENVTMADVNELEDELLPMFMRPRELAMHDAPGFAP